jgi:hypothetical protein
MPTQTKPRTQLSVRVDQRVIDMLNDRIAREKRSGRRVTKEQLVSDAITGTYGDAEAEHGWLPTLDSKFIGPPEILESNSAMLDFLDKTEAEAREAEAREAAR